jgi:hypothetical protein
MLNAATVCSGEYWWRQSAPAPVAVLALLTLPIRISIAASYGVGSLRQSLTVSFSRSETGMDHLILRGMEHNGNKAAPLVTHNLFALLGNTLVTVLRQHCAPQLSLSGVIPVQLHDEQAAIPLAWQHFGIHLSQKTMPGKRRFFARVRDLRTMEFDSQLDWPPQELPWSEVHWEKS